MITAASAVNADVLKQENGSEGGKQASGIIQSARWRWCGGWMGENMTKK